ncbi:MAG TPA: hypothetical protein VEC96_07145 [Anaerolineae bacterium]|nr:hypothetical protein [Anaerolineae bacterium]HXV97082.1 hypothetical protein [Anaerolineae bacterium]
MKLSAPTQLAWIIALILGIVGVIASLVTIPVLSAYAFWIVVIGWLILIIATAIKGA